MKHNKARKGENPNKTEFNEAEVELILNKRGYVPEKQIGRGGYGVCYLVFSQKYKMKFVAKCMTIKSSSEAQSARQEFENEVYSLTHIIHPHIINIYDFFSEAVYLFIIIEYCEYGNLAPYAKKEHRLTYPVLEQFVTDILSALAYCHEEKHISHHDIKLHNILIGANKTVKLCDFGISQVVKDSIDISSNALTTTCEISPDLLEDTPKQNVAGSVPYMSPQLLFCSLNPNHKYDMFAADMWAFGVTLYTLLVGKYPFTGHDRESLYNNQKMIHEIASLNYNTPLSIYKDLPRDTPEDLKHVLMRCLEFPEHRRGTSTELYEYMKNYQNEKASKLQKNASFPSPVIRIPRTLSSKSALKGLHGLTNLSTKSYVTLHMQFQHAHPMKHKF